MRSALQHRLFTMPDRKKIIFTVTNNLEADQRVHKVASFFLERGWDVLVVGSTHRVCHEYKQPYGTKRLSVWFKKGPLFYAEFNIKLFFYLLFKKADRIWGNDTDTALASFLAAKIKRVNYSLDLHELFPEVPEVTNRKFVKWVWTKVEDFVLPRVTDGYTVCQSIANYYKDRYGVALKVLRNVPFSRPYIRTHKFDWTDKKVILYQGAVNEGRGIEWIIRAMPFIDNAIFVIIGKGDKDEEVRNLVDELNLNDKVKFLGFKPFSELSEYTNSADLGVCLLEQKGLSYYFSLPNRIFDFMQAHVPMLATGFPEIKRVLETEQTGVCIDHYEPEYLAEVIKGILAQPVDHDRFSTAADDNCWEKERETILV